MRSHLPLLSNHGGMRAEVLRSCIIYTVYFTRVSQEDARGLVLGAQEIEGTEWKGITKSGPA